MNHNFSPFFLIVFLIIFKPGYSQTSTCFNILTGNDDVEEVVFNGTMDLNSSDIELVVNNGAAQLAGLRFQNITIPSGSVITNAYIQFTVDEATSGDANLFIRGEDVNNSAAFSTASANLSQRSTTSATIGWNPVAWQVIGGAGIKQRTPNISSIINEIISRPGYASGNAISIFIGGSGTRISESYETSPSQAAKLCVTYTSCLQDSDSDGICDLVDGDIKNDIVINEINYRSVLNQEDIEFVEIFNNDVASVDISGWTLSNGIDYTFPSNTSIAAGQYLVVSSSPSDYSGRWAGPVLGPFQRNLSNRKDDIRLVDRYCNKIDEVDYESWKEWPNVRYRNNGDSPVSIQKINPSLPGQHAGSWAAAIPTPRAKNTAVFISNSTNVAVVKSVSKSPNKPVTGEQVRIRVDMSQSSSAQAGPINIALQYQHMSAGSYIAKSDAQYSSSWTTRVMKDDGVGVDSTANNGVYTAFIPSSVQQHRKLIRYRIKITQAGGQVRYYPDPKHAESNYAYYVYDGYPITEGRDLNQLNKMQEISIITKSSTASIYIGTGTTNPNIYTGLDYLGEGTLVYNGKVYDHMRFRPRGKNSRSVRVKPALKFDMNPERSITTQKDCGDDYDVERGKIVLSGAWVGDRASHGLTESLIYKLQDLTGGLKRSADYTQFRIVDQSNESDDFWGLFLILEDYGGDYLKENNLSEGNFWTTDRDTRQRVLDYQGDFPYPGGSNSVPTFAPFDQTNSNSNGRFTINNKGNIPLLFGDRIANEFYGQNGNNYIGKHSYAEYYDSKSGLYHAWWGDMDNAFENPIDDNVWFLRNQTEYGDPLKNRLDIPNSLKIAYDNALRSAYDLMFSYSDNGYSQTDFLVDNESKKIYNPSAAYDWATIDSSRWNGISNDNNINQVHDYGSIDAHVDWYKSWFDFRKFHIANTVLDDTGIPSTPSINLLNNRLNDLRLSNSSYSGSSSFMAMEWRVGEWSDPSNSFYDGDCGAKYEIDTHWSSGEINSFTSNYTIPAGAFLKENRTYLIRVRYKDNTGRWSHWSQPEKVVPTPAVNPQLYNLVINEIMYNPVEPKHAEFIELHNSGNTTIDLTNVEFTDGFDYTFPDGASIPAGEYICIAQDSADFFKAYGYFPFGDFRGSLDNAGELIKLRGPFRAIIDTVRYTDSIPWPATADNGFYSLALKDPGSNNSLGSNWAIQPTFVTPCAANEFTDFGVHPFSGVVINEIHYNPSPEKDNSGAVITDGDKFEFIEFKNITSNVIDLSGAFLTEAVTFTFPNGTLLPPGGFLVLAEDKSSYQDRYGMAPFDKYGGKLSNSGETINFFNRSGVLLDRVKYGIGSEGGFPPFWDGQANGGDDDRSLALINGQFDNNTKLNWKVQCSPANFTTPGRENDHSCVNGTGVNYGSLVINEIHYAPSGGTSLEFIEIVNIDPNNFVNLLDVALTGNGSLMYKFEESLLFGAGSYPNNYIVLAKDAAAYQAAFGVAPFGQYDGDLNDNGETLKLSDLFNNTIDVVSYNNSAPWDPVPATGSNSLALINPSLDNNQPSSWAAQDVSTTPKTVNTFDFCDDYYTILDNSITTTDQSVDIAITTNERIGANAVVNYTAGDSIVLEAEFEVPLGATFHAFIAPCQ